MDLKDAHGKALDTKPNNYMVTSGGTTGLGSLGSDINSYNIYGMTPVQVALQGGDANELKEILAMPGIEPNKPSRDGKATVFYTYVFQAGNHGSNPFEGYTAKDSEGEAIDRRADELRKILKAATPATPAPRTVAQPNL